MEDKSEGLPGGGRISRFVGEPVRKIKEHLRQKGEIEKICKGIRRDSIALLEQRGKKIRVESLKPFERLPHPLFPIIPPEHHNLTVLDTSVKQIDETEPTQVTIISLTPPPRSWSVNIKITGEDYFLMVDRIGGNVLRRLSPSYDDSLEKPVTLEDVRKFEKIIQLIGQGKEA